MESQHISWLKKNWKLTILVSFVFTLIWYFSMSRPAEHYGSEVTEIRLNPKVKSLPPLQNEEKNDKWIVITSINYPTKAIQVFAAQPGWKVVVVGDTKTPEDWSYPNCTFLSVTKQKQLGYRIIEHLPFRSYARKNIGYLYAVQHGAKIIYESDDDNIPSNGLKMIAEQASVVSYVPEEDRHAVNVYAHFGKPEVWPRGYPLRAIQPGKATEPAKSKPGKKFVPIQQGLANYDPDVDAIYRLTQPLKIYFEDSAPISLPEGMMCPWNSQNTLFYNPAFWGLLIPITTTFRVCDIWRSYWAQRILWDIGGELAFLPPSVEQIRNPHDYLLDFEDELDLYLKAEDLIKFLIEWRSYKTNLSERILDLSKAMVEKNYWKIGDAKLMKAWLEDLIAVGYEFPDPVPK
eukprot:TRINITY_DN11979_c0_g2_i1.p2 TRINITY_DN11979_c0_g2~~TRINITY_DN11979_c0_g2_i1.p2  ORF type:complete len:403 (-),score=92.39 TRINITY_DN11979_c0_g2_i1:1387-2595(-)